jgi:hypothetical protein
LIRPILLYGCESWVLTRREENQLLVFQRKVLRTICGLKIENGVYRRRFNHKLDKELSYAGHMNRRTKDLPQKALFRAIPNGRRN